MSAIDGNGPRVLGLVPARGGSKGIPRKNIRSLGGRPLLAWTAEAAAKAQRLTRTIVSTEDEEIAEVAARLGLEVPFLRPAELAGDSTPTIDVVAHAIQALDERFDAVCLLQPTDPFRSPEIIDRCVAALFGQQASCVITVMKVPHCFHPNWVYSPTPNGLRLFDGSAAPTGRRQDLPPAFVRTGSVYVMRTEAVETYGNLYGDRVIGIEQEEVVFNLDTTEDWAAAEAHVSAVRR